MAKKKPPKKAVAMRYEPGRDRAPYITAKGRGELAEEIIALAEAVGVPLRRDPDLIQVLWGLDLDQEIPPLLYVVVAEMLAYVYYVNERYRRVPDRGLDPDVDRST